MVPALALLFSVFLIVTVDPVASFKAATFSSVSGSTIKIAAVGARRLPLHALTFASPLMLSSSTTPCHNSISRIRNDSFSALSTIVVGCRTHHVRRMKTRLHASSSITAGSNNSNINFSILLASAISRRGRVLSEVKTLIRVLLPAIVSGIIAAISLPSLSQHVTKFVLRRGGGGTGMLSDVVTSFISLIGLLYSILMGQVFGFLYTQQEVSDCLSWETIEMMNDVAFHTLLSCPM